MTRDRFFVALTILALANGCAGRMIYAVESLGWWAAIAGTFNISIVVWAACVAGLSLLYRTDDGRIGRFDLAVGTGVLCLAALPYSPPSWVALTGLALHLIRTSEAGSTTRRGSLILLAAAIPMFWSKLLYTVVAGPILEADAVLVSTLLGTERIGNIVKFADGSGSLQIYPACSSLANMSIAILAWVTTTQLVRRAWSPVDLGWCALACAAVVFVNIGRISLIGLFPQSYGLLHGPVGSATAAWISLGFIALVCFLGVRRDSDTLA
jgi:exosortase/archaeosortase family protein